MSDKSKKKFPAKKYTREEVKEFVNSVLIPELERVQDPDYDPMDEEDESGSETEVLESSDSELDSSSDDESHAEDAKPKEPERSGNISNVHIHQNSIFVNEK